MRRRRVHVFHVVLFVMFVDEIDLCLEIRLRIQNLCQTGVRSEYKTENAE